MRITALLAALIVAGLPTLAAAECSWGHGNDQTAMSCAEGTIWDATAQACVDQTTS